MKRKRKYLKTMGEIVAPRAGAWIETTKCRLSIRPASVAPRAGAWIETLSMPFASVVVISRPPRGGVD